MLARQTCTIMQAKHVMPSATWGPWSVYVVTELPESHLMAFYMLLGFPAQTSGRIYDGWPIEWLFQWSFIRYITITSPAPIKSQYITIANTGETLRDQGNGRTKSKPDTDWTAVKIPIRSLHTSPLVLDGLFQSRPIQPSVWQCENNSRASEKGLFLRQPST